jgi:hypothetical protein
MVPDLDPGVTTGTCLRPLNAILRGIQTNKPCLGMHASGGQGEEIGSVSAPEIDER